MAVISDRAKARIQEAGFTVDEILTVCRVLQAEFYGFDLLLPGVSQLLCISKISLGTEFYNTLVSPVIRFILDSQKPTVPIYDVETDD